MRPDPSGSFGTRFRCGAHGCRAAARDAWGRHSTGCRRVCLHLRISRSPARLEVPAGALRPAARDRVLHDRRGHRRAIPAGAQPTHHVPNRRLPLLERRGGRCTRRPDTRRGLASVLSKRRSCPIRAKLAHANADFARALPGRDRGLTGGPYVASRHRVAPDPRWSVRAERSPLPRRRRGRRAHL